MIKFFRRIRKSLIESLTAGASGQAGGSIRKYFLYAFGEIALVVIGILIALQINNWNVNKSEIASFNLILDEIESNIQFDLAELNTETSLLNNQISALEKYVNPQTEISKDSFEFFLVQLLGNRRLDFQTTGVEQMRSTKIIPAVSPKLIDWINLHYTFIESHKEYMPQLYMQPIEDFRKYLIENNLPSPPLTDIGVNKYEKALQEENFQNYLGHLLDIKLRLLNICKYYLDNGEFVLSQIQNRHKLSYSIAMRGSATKKGWEADISLEHKGNGLWEKTIQLGEGELLFKLNSTWIQSWGASSFPNGTAALNGPNIPVKEGHYHLTFDENKGTYAFGMLNE